MPPAFALGSLSRLAATLKAESRQTCWSAAGAGVSCTSRPSRPCFGSFAADCARACAGAVGLRVAGLRVPVGWSGPAGSRSHQAWHRMIVGVMISRVLPLSALAFALCCPAQSGLLFAPIRASRLMASAVSQAAATPGTEDGRQLVGILSAASTEKLLPAAILFKGQLAPVQARNSGAVRHADGTLTIVSLVDSSGYSSGVRERFQFFLYTETPLQLGVNKVLPSGFYGGGFLADGTMVVLDVAGRDVMVVPTTADATMTRAAAAAGGDGGGVRGDTALSWPELYCAADDSVGVGGGHWVRASLLVWRGRADYLATTRQGW